ncbi:MAG: DUF4430 domain-containing protein [Clostridiales bacterium]|nr:DUF4430 domain-containing protein [Clostridiales bacterium]
MKNKKILIYMLIGAAIIAALALAFVFGGEAPDTVYTAAPDVSATLPPSASPKVTPAAENSPEQSTEPGAETTAEPVPEQTGDVDWSESQGMEIDPETGTDEFGTEPVPEGMPAPVEPQDAVESETEYSCTISISCAALLNNMERLDPEKHELVPSDGVILPATAVTFTEGEDVFTVLHRVCKENKIHLEFSEEPIYNTAYVEAINNLYEFDGGELSGWYYSVNGWFPNYGSSRYALKDGDVVEWHYSCEMGNDIEGYAQ